MSVLANISNIIIPVLIFYIVAYGMAAKTQVYESFIRGAKEGLKTVVEITPTLIGLMMAVGVLRASGFLEFLGRLLGKVTDPLGFPGELVPLTLVKMFSSSAATGLVLDIFKSYGTDSLMGMMTSLMMSSTETIFYTMSVYYMVAKVNKTKFTLPGALIATLAGTIASVILAGMIV
ncbi:MAG: spore maturation protein [Lachnospiraceae bacterium]